ncbi:MAG: hypothetical protein P1P76_06800 [Anaerolineales bacterium]|nr:hypothetical protein [Anaerolineales bacterium]
MTFDAFLRAEIEALDQDACAVNENSPAAGGKCPACNQGTLEYDGTLNLVCTECNYTVAGVCT